MKAVNNIKIKSVKEGPYILKSPSLNKTEKVKIRNNPKRKGRVYND